MQITGAWTPLAKRSSPSALSSPPEDLLPFVSRKVRRTYSHPTQYSAAPPDPGVVGTQCPRRADPSGCWMPRDPGLRSWQGTRPRLRGSLHYSDLSFPDTRSNKSLPHLVPRLPCVSELTSPLSTVGILTFLGLTLSKRT